MPRQRMRLSIGDVFQLPLDSSRVGYGQIVGSYERSAYWFAIFERPYEFGERPDVADVVRGRIALLGLSLDALLYHKRWEIVGNAPVGQIEWPTYKESVAPDVFEAVDHTGSMRRPATPEEADRLPYRSVVAPMRLQNAFRALHGAAEWNEEYDKLRYG
jgi:Immunity protein 26